MARCAFHDCNAEVVGGFQPNIDVGNLQDFAKNIGLRRYWREAIKTLWLKVL